MNSGRQPEGSKAYREEWEGVDGRPLLNPTRCRCAGCRKYRGSWASETERLIYADVTETNPRNPGEKPFEYIARLSELAQKALSAAQAARQTSPWQEIDP